MHLPQPALRFQWTFLTSSRYFLLVLSLGVMACQSSPKEALPFYVSPHLGQTVKEAWAGTDSLLISNGIFNPGITRSPWWIKTTLSNPGDETEQYFLVFNNPHIKHIEVYADGADSVLFVMGVRLPFHDRLYQDRDFVMPFELKSGESREVLVLADKAGETLLLEPQLLNEDDFWQKRTSENLLIGLLVGWLSIIFLLAVFYAWELKELSALFYALYIISLLIWFISHWGLGFQFLWPENSDWAGKARPYLNLMTNIIFILVILNFFPPKANGKIIGRILWVIVMVQIIILFLAFFEAEKSVSIETKIVFMYFIFFASLLMTIMVLWYLIIQWQAKVPYAGFYLLGVLFMLFFNIIIQLHQLGVDISIPWFIFSFGSGFGLMGETTLISIAFARKAASYKKEKEKLAREILVKERKVADQLIQVQEEERSRLARDLHDSIGGMLSSIYLKADIIEKLFSPSEEAIQLKQLIKQSIEEARGLSHNLTPPYLDELGLEKTLLNLVQSIREQNDVRVNYFYNVTTPLTKPVELMLYRICSELLNNVIKHANAHEVLVQLKSDDNTLEITLEDDGIGIDNAKKNHGIGLKNIRERVDYLKGNLHMDSNENGTTIIIHFPLNPTKNDTKKD
jgi:signal transduction histidine kinase